MHAESEKIGMHLAQELLRRRVEVGGIDAEGQEKAMTMALAAATFNVVQL